jgi:hypothetical protein
MQFRSQLVKQFRDLAESKRPRPPVTWVEAIKQTRNSIGTISPDDLFAVLVSLTKRRDRPAVRETLLVPFALEAVERIVSDPGVDIRTRAGCLGFLPRLWGSEWEKFLPTDERDKWAYRIREWVEIVAEELSVYDTNGIGFVCDACRHLGMVSEDLDSLLEAAVNANQQIRALPVSQMAQYMAGRGGKEFWRSIASRTSRDIDSYTPANLLPIIASVQASGWKSSRLTGKVMTRLETGTSGMSVDGIIQLLSLVEDGSVMSKRLLERIQRRVKLSILTANWNQISRISQNLITIEKSFHRLDLIDQYKPIANLSPGPFHLIE